MKPADLNGAIEQLENFLRRYASRKDVFGRSTDTGGRHLHGKLGGVEGDMAKHGVRLATWRSMEKQGSETEQTAECYNCGKNSHCSRDCWSPRVEDEAGEGGNGEGNNKSGKGKGSDRGKKEVKQDAHGFE